MDNSDSESLQDLIRQKEALEEKIQKIVKGSYNKYGMS
jgi:hypothetical protein